MNLSWRNHVWALLFLFMLVACGPASAEEKIYIVTSLPFTLPSKICEV